MAIEIPLKNKELNLFLSEERNKVICFLKKTYSLSDDDSNDIFQEAATALYLNIKEGKLRKLTSSLLTYFISICTNQALKQIKRNQKTVPFIDINTLTNKDEFKNDKIDELYNLCTENEDANIVSRSEKIVNSIIDVLPNPCKNILWGYYRDELTTNTIASMYGFANANSVKTQKYKCVNKFKSKYCELMNKIYG